MNERALLMWHLNWLLNLILSLQYDLTIIINYVLKA